MAKLRFVTIYMWIQLFSWSCREVIIKPHGLSNMTDLYYQLKVIPAWKLCLFRTQGRQRDARMLSPCTGSSTGLWHYSECVKVGISGVFTALLPWFGESIASCNGKLLSFFLTTPGEIQWNTCDHQLQGIYFSGISWIWLWILFSISEKQLASVLDVKASS